ncbi:MAG: hypothetical protein E6R04_08075 [Spirochaetes bacterium]|nr:MAG: hypothetical protein E6R04_08075 [Spirochaetota bacterium]
MNHRPQRSSHTRDALLGLAGALLVMLLAQLGQALAPSAAHAAAWKHDRATWYGPGFYGNRTACGHRYTTRIRGVAVPSSGPRNLRCGAKLTICRHQRCVRVRVIDTGAFRSHQFDLSARTAMDLCTCWKPYTMSVRWRRGWLRTPHART